MGEDKKGETRKKTAVKNSQLSKKERRRRERNRNVILFGMAVLVLILVTILFFKFIRNSSKEAGKRVDEQLYDIGDPTRQVAMPQLDVQLLTPNEYSRPEIPTDKITAVVVHYTANPGSTAQNNRDYFESLKDSQDNKVSSNFIVGIDGEIIQCIPTAEVAYASNDRNHDTVSIECCHPDETGEFTEATYDSLVELVAFLCGKFDLTTDDIIRHYDVTGKDCPRYFVQNEDKWTEFKENVAKYISENGE